VRWTDAVRLLMIALCALNLAVAQTTNGTISGIVFDPSGRAIPGAAILIVNDATGSSYPGATNSEGIYAIPNLPPGPYRVQVSKIGFKALIKPDIVLHVQDAVAINFTLPIGAASEIVTVEGGTAMINTTDASVSTVVDQTYVRNMPLNGRSFQDLILLTPGTTTQSPQTAGNYLTGLGQMGEFSVNGQRTESNYYTVDGVSANVGAAPGFQMLSRPAGSGSLPAASALGTTQPLVSVDDLQEFRVQSSTYSAEYGRNPGGQFAFETKSGTNQWHGNVFDYLRNGFVDANDWFNDYFGIEQPALRQNDFGGTLGGPVEVPGVWQGKDKTFFFVSYEGLRLVQPEEATINYVPDEGLRTSAAAALQPVLNAFPVPNGTDVGDGIGEFTSSWSNPSSLNSTSVRLDHIVGAKLRMFFRFSDTPSEVQSRGSGSLETPAELMISKYGSRTYTAAAISPFSDRFSNEFRLNYSSNQVVSSTAVDAFGGNMPADLLKLSGLGPEANVSSTLLYGGYEIEIQQNRSAGLQRQWNWVDTASVSIGRHQLKFGIDYRRLTPIETPYSPVINYLYFSQSAVEANSGLAVATSYAATFPLYTNFSAFAQDQWSLSRRLKLSLGLRWEVDPAPGVTQGLKPYTTAGQSPSTWTLAPQGTELWRTTWWNFAPRVGIAYLVRNVPNLETVLRAGGGTFYDTGQQAGSVGIQGPGFSLRNVLPSAAFPIPVSSVLPIVNPPVSPFLAVYGIAPDLELPYTIQWNATVEQSLGKSQALTLSYVGAHATRLLRADEYSGSAINNPNAEVFLFERNGLTSDYAALQTQFRRRVAQGLTALGSYTWSHCEDYGSQDLFAGYQRGSCDFDVRHSVAAALSDDLPSPPGSRLLAALLGHWGMDGRFTARTGFPITLTGNTLIDPTTGLSYDSGLNVVPGQPLNLFGAECAAVLQGLGGLSGGQSCPGGRAINPDAFALPSDSLGNAPRNLVRGFDAWQMDFAMRREFPVHERLKLQFRAEAFNVFNHPNFGYINSNFGESTFGQATGSLASSLGVLSPIYQMGGPRSMQFALKLTF
jgi:hypothetical protein